MITRIVKMTFMPEEIRKFQKIFSATAELIRSFEGCYDLKLMRDVNRDNVFFTVSQWQSEHHLNAYRSSGLFKTTWADVKPLFSEQAQAWSLSDLL